jgi:hypothetical protein
MIKLCHVTNCDAADAILREGFRDTGGPKGAGQPRSGVWLVDTPFDWNDPNNVRADAILVVSLDCRLSDLSNYKWVQEGPPYGAWVIPADFVNKHTLAIVQFDQNVIPILHQSELTI